MGQNRGWFIAATAGAVVTLGTASAAVVLAVRHDTPRPMAAIATPDPTTARSSPTPTAGGDPIAYLNALDIHTAAVAQAFGAAKSECSVVQSMRCLTASDKVRTAADDFLTALTSIHPEMPVGYAPLNEKAVSSLTGIDAGETLIVRGIRNHDQSDVDAGLGVLGPGITSFGELTGELNAITPGVPDPGPAPPKAPLASYERVF